MWSALRDITISALQPTFQFDMNINFGNQFDVNYEFPSNQEAYFGPRFSDSEESSETVQRYVCKVISHGRDDWL
jgi:hypothetical protein